MRPGLRGWSASRATAVVGVLVILVRFSDARLGLVQESVSTAHNDTGASATTFSGSSDEGLGQEKDSAASAARDGGVGWGHFRGGTEASWGFWKPEIVDVLREAFVRDDTKHKGLWPPNWRDVLTLVCAAVSLFIAAGGGIGGGGVLVPLFILVLGFKTNVAVALSNITIVGGALVNFAFNVNKRHAHFKRPLIDWDLILVMEPATILGALIGGYLNRVSPSYMTTLLLAALLTFLTYKLVTRAIATWLKESQSLRAEANGSAESVSGLQAPLLASSSSSSAATSSLPGVPGLRSPSIVIGRRQSEAAESFSGSPLAYTRVNSMDDFRVPSLRRIGSRVHNHTAIPPISDPLAEAGDEGGESKEEVLGGIHPPLQKIESVATRFGEFRQVPPLKFSILILLFLAVLGADYGKQWTTCGTWQYWTIVLSIVPIALLVTWGVRVYLVRDFHAREAAGYEWKEGDVEWSERNTVVYPAICSLAGLVAGAFGVGGGIVKGPLMLEMGILPDVAAATSATMICFTAASASVVYLSFGGIPMDYAVMVFSLGVLATLVGQLATHWLVTHLNRRSVIIIAMAALMSISMLIIYYEAVLQLYTAIVNHTLANFHPICPSS